MSSATPFRATPDFGPLARVYRWMEWASFGPWLQLCRCAYLTSLSDRRRALVLGDGDGRFASRLLRTNPQIQIDAVDASSAMLQQLLGRAGADAVRVQTECVDIRDWRPSHDDYDLIVSHFFLDCLTTDEIQLLTEKLRRSVSPTALWVISEFAIPQNVYGRLLARPLIATLYRAFGLLTRLATRELPDYRPALRNAGFVLSKERHWLGGILVSELWKISDL